MANVHAAIKAIRQSAKKAARNRSALSELKNLWYQFSHFSKAELTEAQKMGQRLTSKWDRAVARGIVPRGRADRKKTRISHHLTKLSQSS